MDICKVFFLDVSPLSDDALFNACFSKMSVYRQNKIMKFVRQNDRNLSLGAGLLTDVLLQEYNLREKDMVYGQDKAGKPFFAQRKDICFNLSHSGSFAMAVSSSHKVGCDIEKIVELKQDISSLCLSENEKKEDILRIWTMKESFLKKEGCGLNYNLTKLESGKIRNLYSIDSIKGYYAYVCTEYPSDLEVRHINLI